jgi:hypothetical protein
MTEKVEESSPPEIEAEFDMLLARAKMTVPEDRRAGVLAGYIEQKRLAALLQSARSVFDEPANVYDLSRILEGP